MTTPGEAATPGGLGPPSSHPGDDAHRRTVSSLPRLTGEEVRGRSFKRATRGVSEAEVRNFLHRVGEALDASYERERDLETQIQRLEAELRRPPPVNEETILESVGAETVRVLQSARDAANEIREQAESSSAQLVADAESAANARRDEIEAFVAERRREGEEVGGRLREEAEARARRLYDEAEREAAEIRERAEREAATYVAGALERGREMVAEAKAVRERVLTDMARRRRSLEAQLAELRGGRDRLLEGYRVVRRTLSEATQALGGSAPPAPDLDLEALGADEPEPPDAQLDAALAEVAAADGLDGEDEPPAGVTVADDQARETDETLSAGEGESEPLPPDREAVPPGRGLRQYVKGALGLGAEPEAAEDGDEVEIGDVSGTSGRVAPASSENDAGRAGDAETTPPAKPDPQTVFAKLRAEAEPSESAGAVATATPADDQQSRADAAVDGATDEEPSPPPDGDAALVAARDEAVADAEAVVARAVKREAQDEQNELLDAIRRAKRRKDLSPLLPEREEMVAAWSDAIRPGLADAYGSEPPSELVSELAAVLAGPLHDRLGAALGEGGDPEALRQRLGARYREWRSEELEAAVAEVVATAHSRAVFDAVAPGTPLRWVPCRPGRCPDCDDNALEPTPRGEGFPTGQQFPPAHPGCRCLLVVEDA